MGTVIAASLSIIGYISYIFVKIFQLKKKIDQEENPEKVYKGKIILTYANGKYSGSVVDLSKYEKNKIIGFVYFTKNPKAKKKVDAVVLLEGDVEVYADGFCCLGEEAMQQLQDANYWIINEDGTVTYAKDI